MYKVYYTYFNEDGTTSHEYYDSFDNYEDAVKAVDGLNRDPNCQAYIRSDESASVSILKSIKLDENVYGRRWLTTLKSGVELRNLVDEDGEDIEFYQKVLDAIKDCCNEAINYLENYSKTSGEDYTYEISGFNSLLDDIEMIYDDEDLDEDMVDYELNDLYDLCDSARLFVALN